MAAADHGARPSAARAVPVGSGRLLGVDLGSRRIGVAVCDSAGTVATGVATVERRGDRVAEHRALAALVEEHEAVGVVVGLPLALTGEEGPAAVAVAAEVDQMRAGLPVPVDTADERMTTVVAGRALRAAGRRGRQARRSIDREAAAAILQGYLDRARAVRR